LYINDTVAISVWYSGGMRCTDCLLRNMYSYYYSCLYLMCFLQPSCTHWLTFSFVLYHVVSSQISTEVTKTFCRFSSWGNMVAGSSEDLCPRVLTLLTAPSCRQWYCYAAGTNCGDWILRLRAHRVEECVYRAGVAGNLCFITSHFSRPGSALGRVCVCVSEQ